MRHLRRRVGLGFLVLALAAGGGSSASAGQTGWNLAGTWVGQDSGVFVVKQSGTAVTWYGHSADAKTWAHDFKGTLEGDYLVGHFRDRPGFSNRYEGDLVVHILDSNHFVWVPGHNGVTSLAILTRSWARRGGTLTPSKPSQPAGLVDVCLPADCSGAGFAFDESLEPGQMSQVAVGCGVRAVSSAAGARDTSCQVSATEETTPDQAGALAAWSRNRQATLETAHFKALSELPRIPDVKPKVDFSGTSKPTPKPVNDWLRSLPVVPNDEVKQVIRKAIEDGAFEQELKKTDNDLQSLFPVGSDREGAAVFGSTAALSFDPRPVTRAMVSRHPGRADLNALAKAIAIATAPRYTPLRAVARLTLLDAQLIAHDVLRYDLAQLPRLQTVVLASARATVAAGTKRKLTLVPTPLGVRAFRLFGLAGLGHGVPAKLQLQVKRNGKTTTQNRVVAVK